ncbi:MAG: hypothetical protein NVS2B12_02650 [Ktedonobacteraceae bacterium]
MPENKRAIAAHEREVVTQASGKTNQTIVEQLVLSECAVGDTGDMALVYNNINTMPGIIQVPFPIP